MGKVDAEFAEGAWRLDAIRLQLCLGRDECGGLDEDRPCWGCRGIDGHNQVEAEEGEIGQVVVSERLTLQVGVDEAQPPEKPLPQGKVFQFRDVYLPFIAHDHVFDNADPADQDADLPAAVTRSLDQRPGDIGGDDFVVRNPAPVETFQVLDLARFETDKVAVELLDNDPLETEFFCSELHQRPMML